MTDMTNSVYQPIVEIQMDQDIEELIEKQVRGYATDCDRLEFQELIARRSRLMRHSGVKRRVSAS